MRALGETNWYGFRTSAPLTGREPILGRIRRRLRGRGPGWGWITVAGPWGSGVSRVLEETAALLEDEGVRRVVWIRPTPGSTEPLEPLRRALAQCVGETDRDALARRLGDVLQAPHSELDTLAAWLVAGAASPEAMRPDRPMARRLLECLVPGGPLLVDDFDRLDAETRAVLIPSVDHEGPGVIAGISGDVSLAPADTAWLLDPLSASQAELLLRRWLRSTATARRLTAKLLDRTGGWPGRLVESARALGRDGHLVRKGRGIALGTEPRSWPDGRRAHDAFFKWVQALGAPALRVLETAALYGEPADVGIVADAAGVKESLVLGMRAEAVAGRNGAGPDRFFATPEERESFITRMTDTRCFRTVERLAGAWASRPPNAGESPAFALGRVSSYLRAAQRADASAALAHALDCHTGGRLDRPGDVRRMGEVASLFGSAESSAEREVLARLGLRLLDLGQSRAARALLSDSDAEAPLAEVCLKARLERMAGRLNEALARLDLLPPQPEAVPDALRFDVFALQASLCLETGQTRRARQAWCRAGRALPMHDLARRAAFHQGAASCAALDERHRATAAHLRRAVAMIEAQGHVREAAHVRARLGSIEALLGRHPEAVESLERAAHTHRLLGEVELEARARLELGRVRIASSAFEQACQALDEALALAERAEATALLAELHLALAIANRGSGNLGREREHAAHAATLPAPAKITLRANAMVAEADLRAGAPGAVRLLERCERDLRCAGLVDESNEARALLFDARLRSGDAEAAKELLSIGSSAPTMRLGRARLDLMVGRAPEATVALEGIAGDARLSTDLRTVAYAHLADALVRQHRLIEARTAAVSASALMSVRTRSRADDLRVHRILSGVFKQVGDRGRAVSHRMAARTHLRSLLESAAGPGEGRRLARAQWRMDPSPDTEVA